MKLATLLIIFSIMQVSATGFAQKITLSEKSITLKKVFDQIRSQTGYDFVFTDATLNGVKPVSIQVENEELKVVLDQIFKDQQLEYKIEDKYVVVSKKEVSLIESVKEKISNYFQQDSVIYRGKVLDEKNQPLLGATIKKKGENKITKTNNKGEFTLYGPRTGAVFVVSYIGYGQREIKPASVNEMIEVRMNPASTDLNGVEIVSDGYWTLPKERATGSFEVITKEQLQLSSSPNLLKRLEGLVASMDFRNDLIPTNSATAGGSLTNQNKNSLITNLTIRGKNNLATTSLANTVETSGRVLVVIDGIADPYPIDQVDPDKVESVVILKDGAASSIWGSRASNGVIVITTKRARQNQPLSISFNSNLTVSEKFNLFYKKMMSTSDYIDGQVFLYNQQFGVGKPGVPDATSLTSPQPFMSPVAEIMNQQKIGQITITQRDEQLNLLRGNDIRNDFSKYILRNAVNQKYSLTLGAGTRKLAYHLSGNYNKTLNNTVGSSSNDLTLTYSTSYKPIEKLNLGATIEYLQSNDNSQSSNNTIAAAVTGPYYLYTRLADDQGNPLSMPFVYRPGFVNLIASAYGDKVLPLDYTPLLNINEGYLKTSRNILNLRFNADYQLNKIFSVNVTYSYVPSTNEQVILSGQNSFYTRDLITSYTARANYTDPDLGPIPFFHQIPLGGIYRTTWIENNNQELRGTLNTNLEWNKKNTFNAIIGFGGSEGYSKSKDDQYYGYDEKTGNYSTDLNYSNYITSLLFNVSGSSFARIPYVSGFGDTKTRTISAFANSGYSYNNKYFLTASVRKDMSSLYGTQQNSGGSPFFSFGSKWNISAENFYNIPVLSLLQLRATFGYNGNNNNSVTSRPLITYSTGTATNGLLTATIQNYLTATNNLLGPEKTADWNFGLDFGFRNGRFSGSLDYYDKRTSDLISTSPVDPSTGNNRLSFNTANLRRRGLEFGLSSRNLQHGKLSWNSGFSFSYNRTTVTKLFSAAAKTAVQVVTSLAPNEGYDLNRLFAYKWAGLDPITGDPRGYVNGQAISISNTAAGNTVSSAIQNSPQSEAVFFGSSVPVYQGAFSNALTYGSFSASFRLLYKLGYYFRRPFADVVYYSNFFSNTVLGAEFSRRWQKPGDELITNVPSMTYPGTIPRDQFYGYSEINVLKADHIRIQQVNLGYSFGKKGWFVKNPRVYANIPLNIVIWRANKLGLDPDINDYPAPKAYSFGFSCNF